MKYLNPRRKIIVKLEKIPWGGMPSINTALTQNTKMGATMYFPEGLEDTPFNHYMDRAWVSLWFLRWDVFFVKQPIRPASKAFGNSANM